MAGPAGLPQEEQTPPGCVLQLDSTRRRACGECSGRWTVDRVDVAPSAAVERTCSPDTHQPLLTVLAAMVREALTYEREFGREAA